VATLLLLHALKVPAPGRKRLDAALLRAASPMGASDRVGENRRIAANRFLRPADMSALLNSDCFRSGEAAKRSAEQDATGGHVPHERGVFGVRTPDSLHFPLPCIFGMLLAACGQIISSKFPIKKRC
jgi:hypothetical protein